MPCITCICKIGSTNLRKESPMPSFEQSKSSKLWSVRFRTMIEGKEVNKRLSGFRTKKEAQQGYLAYLASDKPEKLAVGGLTFDALLEAYLAYLRGNSKESSVYDIESKCRNRILPYFTGKRVASIKALDVQGWLDSLTDCSFSYKQTLRSQMSTLLLFAYRYYDIPSVMPKVLPLRNNEPKKEMECWSEDEFAKFLACVPEQRVAHRIYFLTLYLLGCRKGEALALTWKDIDLEQGVVTINKSVTRKTKDAEYKVTTPKNQSSNRKVSIPDSLCAEFALYRLSLGERATDESFVFGVDRPLADSTTDRIFAAACAEAGVKKIRIHDLRHSCASLLISRGISIVAVSKRLGHSKVEQTLNTYSHLMPRDDELMLKIADEIVAAVGTKHGNK